MEAPIRHILLADDDEDDRLLFSDALGDLGSRVKLSCVHDGAELMNLLKRNGQALPDVLFLDMNMPVKDGLNCLVEINGSDLLRQIPVIVLSSSDQEWFVANARRLGAKSFVRKPESFQRLREIIQTVVIQGWSGLSNSNSFLVS